MARPVQFPPSTVWFWSRERAALLAAECWTCTARTGTDSRYNTKQLAPPTIYVILLLRSRSGYYYKTYLLFCFFTYVFQFLFLATTNTTGSGIFFYPTNRTESRCPSVDSTVWPRRRRHGRVDDTRFLYSQQDSITTTLL